MTYIDTEVKENKLGYHKCNIRFCFFCILSKEVTKKEFSDLDDHR